MLVGFHGRPRLRLVYAIRVLHKHRCKCRRRIVCGSRENFRLRLIGQATTVIMVCTSREIRVRDWPSSSGGWVGEQAMCQSVRVKYGP